MKTQFAKKMIAWGSSKLLELYLVQAGANPFSYYIDDFSPKKNPLYKMPLKKSDALPKEKSGSFQIVIFAMSSRSLQQITLKLNNWGLNYGEDFIYYSDFFYDNFKKKTEKYLGFELNPTIYRFANSFTLNSRVLMNTSIPGTWLFLELLNHLNKVQGAIAEVGAFQGGNALCALNFMVGLAPKKYYIFDSFEGFPELSKFDPKQFHKGDHKIETSFQEIQNAFAIFTGSQNN